MQRVRRAAAVAPLLVVALCLSSLPAAAIPAGATVALAASVPWPPSTLVVSELQTGGSSASDEFVEIANQGAGPTDLIGLELMYATSSGSTVTRKATWIDVDDPRVRPADPRRQRRGLIRGHRRRLVHRRFRGDGRRRRAASRRWHGRRCGRLG